MKSDKKFVISIFDNHDLNVRSGSLWFNTDTFIFHLRMKQSDRNITIMCATKEPAVVLCIKCSHQMRLHIIHTDLTVFFSKSRTERNHMQLSNRAFRVSEQEQNELS